MSKPRNISRKTLGSSFFVDRQRGAA